MSGAPTPLATTTTTHTVLPSITSDRTKYALLSKLYYGLGNPVSFSSPQKLYQTAKAKIPSVTLAFVKEWLSRQKAYALHKDVKKRFKRRKVLVPGIHQQYQADLLDVQDLSQWNDDVHYLLTLIDCFSRYAKVIPMKRKSMFFAKQALKEGFEAMGKIPQKLQTDGGPEFMNYVVKDFLNSQDVILFATDQELKAQIVERFNRTIRNKIKRYMIAYGTFRYLDVLPQLVDSYNNSLHSSLGGIFTPASVNKDNERLVRHIQYGPYLAEKKRLAKFKVGDTVRVANYSKRLKKKKRTFREELYVIHHVNATNPPTYRVVRKADGFVVDGSYYENELQKVY